MMFQQQGQIFTHKVSMFKLSVYNRIYMYDSDLCTLCNLLLQGDEYQYVLICPYFRNRDQYLKPYYYIRPNLLKFEQLFCSTNRKTQSRLAKFVTIIMKNF